MTQYRLIYFPLRARAEISRLIFAAAGVKYEDVHIDRAKWPQLKHTTPFGQLPVLEVNKNVRLCQSKTIARYLAGQFDLVGKTELDKARADMIVECIDDLHKPTMFILFEKDEAKKAELTKAFTDEKLASSLKMLENILKENNGGDSYFIGDSMTWADIAFIDFCSWLGALKLPVPLNDSPQLKALKERVEKSPKISEWIAKRPDSPI
jgi:glutathione S-transferase